MTFQKYFGCVEVSVRCLILSYDISTLVGYLIPNPAHG